MGKKLFSFGSNSHGQLGTGTTSDAHIPIECILPAGAEPLSVSCGANHSLLITTSARLAGCGSNLQLQLGALPSQRELTTFEYLDIAPDPSTQFTHIACGFNHSLALDSSHNVYAWGENSCGQVDGVPSKIPCSPIVIPLPTPAAAIAASLRYSAALLQNGEVWVWGDFVGMSQTGPSCLYRPATELQQCISVDTGQFHIILATKSGSVVVIMTGGSKKNRFGQMGVDPKSICTPYSLPDDINPSTNLVFNEIVFPEGPVVHVYSGWSFCAAVLESKECIIWGRSDLCQIPGTPSGMRFMAPAVVPALSNATHICLGSESGIAIFSTGKATAWGWNEHGNCGVGSTENIELAASVDNCKFVQGVDTAAGYGVCGYGHTFVILEDIITTTP